MPGRVDGGLFGVMARTLLLAMVVWVGSNFVRSVTHAMGVAAGERPAHLAQPFVPPRSSAGFG